MCMAAVDRANHIAGLACAYNYNPPSSIYLAFTPARLNVAPALVAESMYLLAGVCFTQLPIERVYVELAGYVIRSDDVFRRLFQRVASFPRHVYWSDQLWDVDHWTLSRQTFIQECEQLACATQAAKDVSDISTALRRGVEMVPGCSLDGDLVVAGDSLAVVELAVVLEQALQVPAEAVVECFSNRHSVPVGEVLALRGSRRSPRPAGSD